MAGILPDNIEAAAGPISAGALPDANLDAAIAEWRRKNAFEWQRSQLSNHLSEVLKDDIAFEADRTWGTESTRETYTLEFRRFRQFCLAENLPFLPTSPETVAYFILKRAGDGIGPKSLERAVSAIKFIHQLKDASWSFDEVMIRAALRFVRRAMEEPRERDSKTETGEQRDGRI